VRWNWEKGPQGRVGFVKCALHVNGSVVGRGLLRVEPWKLSLDQYVAMLDEIAQIAYNIVYDLRHTTFEHLDLVEPFQLPKSGVEWLETIHGFLDQLEHCLVEINKQPYVRLNSREADRFVWLMRRPGPSLLARVVAGPDRDWIPDSELRLSQRLGGRIPLRLPEAYHEVSTNTYENQLIAQFLDALAYRLHMIRSQATRYEVLHQAEQLLRRLAVLQSLPFLADVTPLEQPAQPTLVLLRNFRYRQFYEIFRRIHWGLRIRFGPEDTHDLFRLTTRHVHRTYQAWAFFEVIEAVRSITGMPVVLADQIAHVLRFGELLVSLAPGSYVVLRGARGPGIVVSYQRHYGPRPAVGPYSVSLPKIPDIVLALEDDTKAVVFDAKYRLDSEERTGTIAGPGEPKLEDIDKMHAYRDAIRSGPERQSYVAAAYVLYPGSSLQTYDGGRIGALALRPMEPRDPLIALLERALLTR
jgi:hypothetical protein